MATFRVNKDKNYTTINNTGLKDKRLSWKAKGILAYILTLPDDWVFIERNYLGMQRMG